MAPTTKTKVVLIGAGIGGLALAMSLIKDKSLDVVVIDKRKDFQYVKYGGLRSVVQGGPWTDRALVPTQNALKGATFVHGAATSIDEANKTVSVEGHSEPVPYDYLVIASGARNFSIAEPFEGATTEDIKTYLAKHREAIANAKHILVTGGGAVSIELVGELRDKYSDKKITLLPGKKGLLGNFLQPAPKGGVAKITKVIQSRKIDIVENETLTSPAYPTDQSAGNESLVVSGVKLSSGKEIADVDLILFCLGPRVSTSFVPTGWLDETTHEVKIDKHTLQVIGKANVFAFGDAAKTETTKFGYTASMQADVVASNLKSAILGKPLKAKFKFFDASVIILPVGRAHGRVLTPWFTGGDWLSSKLKGRGLLGKYTWSLAKAGSPPKAPGAT